MEKHEPESIKHVLIAAEEVDEENEEEKGENFYIKEWEQLKTLLLSAQQFTVRKKGDFLALSPIAEEFRTDLELLVNESSFFTRLQIIAMILEGEIHLRPAI
ncbi:MAG: hypothetical protein ACFFBD_14985 [Candidatus Hodarchaeota archaeon]